MPIAEIDFTSPARKRQKIFENTPGPSDCSAKQEDHGGLKKIVPTDEELGDLYKALSTCGKSAILSIVPNHCDDYVPAYIKGTVPSPLTNLFQNMVHCHIHVQVKATQWGCKCEQTARDTYIALKEKLYQNLKVCTGTCGLFINPIYPHECYTRWNHDVHSL